MSLKRQLVSGFGVLLLVVLACVAYGIGGSWHIRQHARALSAVTYPVLDRAQGLAHLVRATNQAIVQAIDGDEFFAEEVGRLQADFHGVVAQLQEIDRDPGMTEILVAYDAFVEQGVAFGKKVLADPKRVGKDLQKISAQSAALTRRIEQFRADKERDLVGSLEGIGAQSRAFQHLFAGLGVVLLLVMTLILVVGASLLRAVAQLRRHAERLAAGDLEASIAVDRRDELGVLQRGFEDMRQALRGQIRELDRRVQERTANLQASRQELADILDAIDQGIFTFNPDLSLNQGCSRRVGDMLGGIDFRTARLGAVLRFGEGQAESFANWMALMGQKRFLERWERYEPLCPVKELQVGEGERARTLRVDYRPILDGGGLGRVMVLLSDITDRRRSEEELSRSRGEQEAQLERVTGLINHDPADIHHFLAQADQAVDEVRRFTRDEDLAGRREQVFRALHTLKGNGGSFGFDRMGACVSRLEDLLQELRDDPRVQVIGRWRHHVEALEAELEHIHAMRRRIYSDHQEDRLGIDAHRYQDLLERMRRGALPCSPEVYAEVYRLNAQPLASACRRYLHLVQRMRQRLGKDVADLEVETPEAQVSREFLACVDGAVIHVLRNAMDHGIESDEERLAKGKGRGHISLAFVEEAGEMVLRIRDDGRGVDVDALARRVVELGLRSRAEVDGMTMEDKLDMAFLSDISTTSVTNEYSGRGVGLAAVRAAITGLEGAVVLRSTPGHGCVVELRLPAARFGRLVAGPVA